MLSRRVFEDILQEPLGPYYDHEILHKTACQMVGNTRLVLYSFVLEHDGQVIGLDKSERRVVGEDHRKFRFRGKLSIVNPDWLSESGRTMVETELNLRAKERALREGGRSPPPFTLDDLFSDGLLKISNDATCKEKDARRGEDEPGLLVLIQGERNMPANYMQSDRVPNGLLWNSKDGNRNYEVATMDVEVYSRSENFFWQWRLFALMKKIVQQFPSVPTRQRTPIWFVDAYLQKFACPATDKHQRIMFDSDDSDVDDMGKTVTPRHLLRPHTSEILGLFATHVNWLITNDVVRREKLLDFSSWEQFARKARETRKEAARHGVKWGSPMGIELEEPPEGQESSEDEIERRVRQNPMIGKSNEAVVRKMRNAQAKPDREKKPLSSSESESEGDAGGAVYASDFLESSDTEEDSDNRPTEEEVMDHIPWQLCLPPCLPDVDGRWWCPLRECNYHIDLHSLAEGEERGVPRHLIEYIQQKKWRNAAYDRLVLQGFKYMVTNHYSKHLEERGVRIERDGRMRFTFIHHQERRRVGKGCVRGPMPARGTLGGESRVIPIVHAPQVGHV